MTDLLDADPESALLCQVCGESKKTAAALSSHIRNRHPEAYGGARNGDGGEEPDPAAPTPKRRFFDRLWNPPPKAPREPKPQKERKPTFRRGRVSTASLWEAPFSFGSDIIGGASPSLARMLAVESPYAGHVLDAAIEGTMVDRMVQPIARAEDRFMMAGSVVGPLVICFQIDRTVTPRKRAVLRKALVLSLRESAPYMAQGMAKKRKRDEEVKKAFAELWPDLADETPSVLLEQLADTIIGPAPEYAPTPTVEGSPANVGEQV